MEFIDEEKIRNRNREFETTRAQLDYFVNQQYSNILKFIYFFRIPPEFPWPKIEKVRTPLNPITNTNNPSEPSSSSQRSSQDLERLFYCTPPSPAKTLPMLSSCADYTNSSQTSQQHLSSIYPPSLEFYTTSSQLSNRTQLFASEETFSLTFSQPQNEIKQEIEQQFSQHTTSSPKTNSNHSSPSKYRVLNTPERPDRINRQHDWLK